MATSSTDAEVVAAFSCIKTYMLPALALWENVLARKVVADFREDNQAMIQTAKTGKNSP